METYSNDVCIKAQMNAHILPILWLYCIYFVCICCLGSKKTQDTQNQWCACHVVLTGPAGGDGWCIYEAPFRALDQGLQASSSQTERGRVDQGMMEERIGGRLDGWREGGENRTEGFRDGKRESGG